MAWAFIWQAVVLLLVWRLIRARQFNPEDHPGYRAYMRAARAAIEYQRAEYERTRP